MSLLLKPVLLAQVLTPHWKKCFEYLSLYLSLNNVSWRTLVTYTLSKSLLVSNSDACSKFRNFVNNLRIDLNAHTLSFAAAIVIVTLCQKRSVLDASS